MVYFDNAATSYPKPPAVSEAVVAALRRCGNPGRGGHFLAQNAAEQLYACRELLAKKYHAQPENTVFTLNATHAINIALKGLALGRGRCHILLSDLEHNAVVRPVYALGRQGWRYSVFRTSGSTEDILASLARAVRPDTGIVAVTAASNICCAQLPIREIGQFCRKRRILLLVDAAQAAGHRAFDLEQDGIDALCAPGHKGLYGPLGCGFALFSANAAKRAVPILEGGSGVNSAERDMPALLPERLEAGSLALPAIAGLAAGIRFVNDTGEEAIARHEAALCRRLREMLEFLPSIRLYGTSYGQNGSILLFNFDGVPSEQTAAALSERGVCLRAGLHCAPLAHKTLRTPEDGAVRLSVSAMNSMQDCETFFRALRGIRV